MLSIFSRLLSFIQAYIVYFFQAHRARIEQGPWAEKATGPNLTPENEAQQKLDIIIVGCGLGGLTAAYTLGKVGHKVTVLEAATVLGEIGAGIQLAPNVSRILIRWGLKDKLDPQAVNPQSISFRRFDSGERVGIDIFGEKMVKDYGAPYYHAHRADVQKILCDLAEPYMNLRLNSRVVCVSPDPPSPHVVLASGEVVYGDMIIGADGVKSIIRTCIVQGPDAPTPTGDSAYRATMSTESMLRDPELKTLVDNPESTLWMGPNKHVVGYCLRAKKEYNLVMIHPDDASTESWTCSSDVNEMFKTYEGWDPRLRKLQAMVTSVLKSRLMVRLPLKTWIHSGGRVALIGDACHPMLPYRAQGASMAIEDAAVLGGLFSHITSKSQVPALLKAYEALRYDRASGVQLTALSLQKVFHYPDGPEQCQRDAAMLQTMDLVLKEARGETIPKDAFGKNQNAWVDKAKKDALLGHDVEEEVEEWWSEHGSDIVGQKGLSIST
ncbi:hypothetical protein AX14_004040 [Amanita brunnescens Koide BX004]|nr:hypothetical protein AX14_004040 [Amanita brunnescens Koide BX004]